MEQKELVILDKDILKAAVNAFENEVWVPVPQLGLTLLKLPANWKIKVRGASLEDRIVARDLGIDPTKILQKIFAAVKEQKEFDIENMMQSHEKYMHHITIFQRAVIEPKFTHTEVEELAQIIPDFVNDVCSIALNMSTLRSEYGD